MRDTVAVNPRTAGEPRISWSGMGRRQRRRGRETVSEEPPAATDYRDDEGNVLILRDELSPGTVEHLREQTSAAAASLDDIEARRSELLFERLAVRWEIAGLPLEGQAELLGRYRMAGADERRWVARTLIEHARRRLPELGL